MNPINESTRNDLRKTILSELERFFKEAEEGLIQERNAPLNFTQIFGGYTFKMTLDFDKQMLGRPSLGAKSLAEEKQKFLSIVNNAFNECFGEDSGVQINIQFSGTYKEK